MPAPVTDLPGALFTGLTAGLVALIAAIPAILGAILILVLGWIISGIVAGLVGRALRAVRVDAMADRAGVHGWLRRAQMRANVSNILAGVVKWYLRLIFILMAADAVKLTAVSTIVNQVLAFIPNLLVAAAILAVFAWLAGFVRKLVTGALQPTMPNANTIGVLAYVATFGFGLIAAATQIGVATVLIDMLFAGIVAGIALAFGLAFGLGGRDEAAQVWHQLRASTQSAHDVGEPEMRHGNGRPRVESEPEPILRRT
jgi:mechanosensitive ion channel-like protein